jgi:protein-disulfide isomerase
MTKTLIFLFIILLSNISNAENKLNDYEIESVIKKYILENPEIIIQSLEQYTISQKEKESKGITSILNNFYKNKTYQDLPSIGEKNNNLILVEFIDYNCGYCRKTLPTITKLVKQFPNILIVFVDFPILSETSELAARAALAADKQEAYFKFHTILLNNSNAISEDFLLKTAKSLDLNIKKFKNDMQSQQTKNAIKNNIQFANSLKIRGTPTFIIGNQILPGAYDYDKLKNIILNNS